LGANRHFAGLFNLFPEDFVGRIAGSISGGHEYGQAIQSFIKGGADQDLREVRIPIANELRWFLLALKKYGDPENPFYLLVALDIENQKRVESELEDTKAKSQESARLAALGVMASGIAHEINNPLAILHGRLEQIIEAVQEPTIDVPYAVELARKCETVIDRIARIVRGLQTLSRNSANQGLETVSVTSIFEDISELCATRFRNEGIRLDLVPPPPGLSIQCRPTQIGQVILNLMNNSFDAVEALPERWVRVAVEDRGEFIELRVTDSGLGISNDVVGKIFDPFFTTKAVGKGTGLGLSTSRSIAEAHGGNLRVDSTETNTCFVLTLPKEFAQAQAQKVS
jgi:C4-dicarboxylate-specific signal transduction histidine kinase